VAWWALGSQQRSTHHTTNVSLEVFLFLQDKIEKWREEIGSYDLKCRRLEFSSVWKSVKCADYSAFSLFFFFIK